MLRWQSDPKRAECRLKHASGEDVPHDLARDIREPKVPTRVAIRQSLVVDPHQLEHCGVKIVNVDRFLDGAKPEVIGRAMDMPASDPATGKPYREAPVVMVPPLAVARRARPRQFDGWSAPELTAAQDQRVFKDRKSVV